VDDGRALSAGGELGHKRPESPHAGRGEPAQRIADAAVAEVAERGIGSIRFADLWTRAGIARATAYRTFPDGLTGVFDYLHQLTLAAVVEEMGSWTSALPDRVSFAEAVAAGVHGFVRGLQQSSWTGFALRQDRDAMTSYLLTRQDGSLLQALGDFVARCAAIFGTTCDDLRQAGDRFAWLLVVDVLGDYPATSPDAADWPDVGDSFGERWRQQILQLQRELAIDRSTLSRLAIPFVPLPHPSSGPAIALVVRNLS